MRTATILSGVIALGSQAIADSVHQVEWDGDWADPAILAANGALYMYATGADGPNVKLAWSHDDGATFQTMKDGPNLKDPLPSIGAWSKPNDPHSAQVWAPDVIQLPTGGYVMYYAAISASDDKKHCVGAATSDSPEGPFQPIDNALACPLDEGGAIDPVGFIDGNDIYVAYKVDGNSIGKRTPIRIQQMEADGVTLHDKPWQALSNDHEDGPLVEAPSLVKVGGTYFLFFSSNMFDTTEYDTSYAWATDIRGAWTKVKAPDAPLFKSGIDGLIGPGGADILDANGKIVFHGWTEDPKANGAARHSYMATVHIDEAGKKVTIQ
ncbi:hypothetical protein KEM56_007271 [Ascosphaera pollenicola]|nr:hypothetical protein KEM56_007271 [Ascosphaera pollenicola]